MNKTKTAMITVCGRPNVGKSSLTNALVGEKIAIVSDKPQTTRNRIYGVVNRGDTQFVLLDTPGLHKPRSRLGDYMVKVVRESLASVEAALLLEARALPEQAKALEEILGCVRKLLRCEVLEEPFVPETLCGLTEREQRARSQNPQKYYGCPHFMPEPHDSPAILRLNRLRTQIRETELAAAAAFGRDREDILRALNRLSSLVYILMLQCKGETSP